MRSPEDQLGRVKTISRLYELINSLSEEQQISLLRQLFHDELPNYIFKMILDMPENQQLMIADQLEEMINGEMLWNEEVTVIDIDGRRGLRKPCVIVVDFEAESCISREIIRDISVDGAFIKTDQPLSIGQEVALSFSLPNLEKSFELAGRVVRCNGEGIGVKFVNLNRKQQDIMMSFIESMGQD